MAQNSSTMNFGSVLVHVELYVNVKVHFELYVNALKFNKAIFS